MPQDYYSVYQKRRRKIQAHLKLPIVITDNKHILLVSGAVHVNIILTSVQHADKFHLLRPELYRGVILYGYHANAVDPEAVDEVAPLAKLSLGIA